MKMTVKSRKINDIVYQQLVNQGMHAVLARVLAARVETADAPHSSLIFKSPHDWHLKDLIPPLSPSVALSEMLGLRQACEALIRLAQARARLLIVADYDCDGATACSVMLLGLRRLLQPLGLSVDFVVPNRFTMGYGLTVDLVNWVHETYAPNVLLTVDNGIANVDGVALANHLGMEVIITDHHLPGDHLPAATAIVNPNQPNCPFPSKSIAGVGVAFYVLMALRRILVDEGLINASQLPRLDDLLPLVALGTVADVVRLDDNNRLLVQQGLNRMRMGQMPVGLKALFAVAGKDYRQATSQDLGFAIGPRINAAGRLEDMTVGILCLTTEDISLATELAGHLNQYNQARRSIESDIKDQLLATLDENAVSDQKGLVLYDPDWHEGVIGIVAGRLKERWHRPVIVFAKSQHSGQLKGSGRSIPGFHLRDAIDYVAKKMAGGVVKYGGHAMAAGVTLEENALELFQQHFAQVADQWLSDEMIQRVYVTDGEIDGHAWGDLTLATELEQYVWGQGFPEPIFQGVFKIVKQIILKDKHLKLVLQPTNSQQTIEAIWFFQGEPMVDDTVELLFQLSVNRYGGQERLQLMVVDRV